MSIIVNNTQEKSELQARITAELREKRDRKSSVGGKAVKPKLVDNDLSDSQYESDLKNTTSIAWMWALVIVGLLAASVYIMTL